MAFNHTTVLLEETVGSICVKRGGVYIDMTLGGGGHSALVLERGGRVIGFDRDKTAIDNALVRFAGLDFTAVHANFADIKKETAHLGIDKVDGIIADLGVSSPQLDDAQRGFSYMQNAPLDMRMDKRESFCARDVVNGYTEEELFRVISSYGEERWASRIAEFIVNERKKASINTTFELVDIIKAAIPLSARKDGPHPAKRTFQAIRIEVNGELRILHDAVCDGVSLLKKGGRMSVITFHSLEDRIVKTAFAELERGCICPREFPVCVCGRVPQIKSVTRKPAVPSEEEVRRNPRARSSKLRTVEKTV